jgi:hypothetical protein
MEMRRASGLRFITSELDPRDLDMLFPLEYKCCGEKLRRSTESNQMWVGYTLALFFILLVSSERRNLRRLNPVILASDFFLRSPGARPCCADIVPLSDVVYDKPSLLVQTRHLKM